VAPIFASFEFDYNEFSVSIYCKKIDPTAAIFPLREFFREDKEVIAYNRNSVLQKALEVVALFE